MCVSRLFNPLKRQGIIDLRSLMRYLSNTQRDLILRKIKGVEQKKLVEFVRKVRSGTSTELFTLSDNDFSIYALAALKQNLISEAQAFTLHIHIAALIEFFHFRHEHQYWYDLSGYEVERFTGDITKEIEIHHFSSNKLKQQFQNHLGLVDTEWDYFCQLMQNELASEQYYCVLNIPNYFIHNPALRETSRLTHAFGLLVENDTTKIFVPSFTMLQNRIATLANYFDEREYLKMQPSFGDITQDHIEALKASGRTHYSLPCPLLAPSDRKDRRLYYFKKFHGFENCGPFGFDSHEFYHVWKETLTRPAHRDAMYYIMSLLREFMLTIDLKTDDNFRVEKYINRIIKYIVDGDVTKPTVQKEHIVHLNPVNFFYPLDKTFNYSIDCVLLAAIGSRNLHPDQRALIEPAWEFIRERYRQYMYENPGSTDWRDHFAIDPEKDLEINKIDNKSSM